MAWFWRVFILLFVQWRSRTWVFGLQVMITGWSSKVRLSFDTCMLHVSCLVRGLTSVGGVKRISSMLGNSRFRLVDLDEWSLCLLEVLGSPGGSIFCFPYVVERSWRSLTHIAKIVALDLGHMLREELLWFTNIKVRISALLLTYLCYSSWLK
jgi:hypothetical protein